MALDQLRPVINLFEINDEQATKSFDEIVNYKSEMDTLDLKTEIKIWLTQKLTGFARSVVVGNIRMIIIRGLPGSGKSTLAKQLQSVLKIRSGKIAEVCEADAFMGETFNAETLADCHEQCQNAVRICLRREEIAIISNTNTTLAEMEIYRKIALEEKVSEGAIMVIEPLTPWKYDPDQCLAKTIHKTIPLHIAQRYLLNLKNQPTTPDIMVKMRGAKMPVRR